MLDSQSPTDSLVGCGTEEIDLQSKLLGKADT